MGSLVLRDCLSKYHMSIFIICGDEHEPMNSLQVSCKLIKLGCGSDGPEVRRTMHLKPRRIITLNELKKPRAQLQFIVQIEIVYDKFQNFLGNNAGVQSLSSLCNLVEDIETVYAEGLAIAVNFAPLSSFGFQMTFFKLYGA